MNYNTTQIKESFKMKTSLLLVLGFFLLILFFLSVYTVQAGERKIVKRFGKAVAVSGEGIHIKVPIMHTLETVNIRTHKIEDKDTTAGTSDLQTVTTSVALNYHYSSDNASLLKIIRRTGFDALDEKIILPRISEVVKAVTAQYKAEDLLRKRTEVKQKIDDRIRKSLEPYDLIVEDIQLTDFNFSKKFTNAIETKQEEEQRALTAQNILTRNKTEAEARIVKAEAEAEAIRIQSQAIQSQGGSDYVQLKAIEKWTGELPQYSSGGAMPFIDVKPVKK